MKLKQVHSKYTAMGLLDGATDTYGFQYGNRSARFGTTLSGVVSLRMASYKFPRTGTYRSGKGERRNYNVSGIQS